MSEDWNYCFYCSAELIPQTSVGFAYDQLYDLMKLEENRREYLDTKAGTYIGLLGISVSILTAFGGIITIQSGQIQKVTENNAIFPHWLLTLFYILYFLIVVLFIIAVIFAFRAYGTGSLSVCSGSNKSDIVKGFFVEILIPREKKVYKWIGRKFIVENKDSNLVDVRRYLVDHIENDVLSVNYDLNDKKANRIKRAYISTIIGIIILLLLVLLIGAKGIGLI